MLPSQTPRLVIRIAIVDDHAIVRQGLRQFFTEQPDLQVVAEAEDGRGVLEILRQGGVDLIVLDLNMPEQSGLDTLAAIRMRAPELPVLVLSGYAETHYAMTILQRGANGYLNKHCDPDEILRAIRVVARGRRYVTSSVAEQLADRLASGSEGPAHDALSDRELQVFLRLARGETVGHIAPGLSLSVKTVSTYRTRVMEKLRLSSNSDLTYYALKSGLIQ